MNPDATDPTPPVQGEGDYEAARRHRESTEAFVKSGAVPEAAEAAAPADAEEAEQLRDAEAEGLARARG